jgi:hypothetical protein
MQSMSGPSLASNLRRPIDVTDPGSGARRGEGSQLSKANSSSQSDDNIYYHERTSNYDSTGITLFQQ